MLYERILNSRCMDGRLRGACENVSNKLNKLPTKIEHPANQTIKNFLLMVTVPKLLVRTFIVTLNCASAKKSLD